MHMTIAQLSKEFNVNYGMVWRAINEGYIDEPNMTVGKRTRLFDEKEVERMRPYFALRKAIREQQLTG